MTLPVPGTYRITFLFTNLERPVVMDKGTVVTIGKRGLLTKPKVITLTDHEWWIEVKTTKANQQLVFEPRLPIGFWPRKRNFSARVSLTSPNRQPWNQARLSNWSAKMEFFKK
jgi:hypothetical protein